MNVYTDVGFQATNLRAADVNPAWLPQGIATSQQGVVILQEIFAMYVNNVTNCAQTPARIRYLNEACVNQFQNQEVSTACAEIMDFIKMALFDKVPWQDSLGGFVAEVILYRVALLISNDQYLQSLLDQGQYNEVMVTLEKYQLHKQKAELYRQRGLQADAGGGAFANSGILNNLGHAGMNRNMGGMRGATTGSFAAVPFSGINSGASVQPQSVYKKKFVAGKPTQPEETYHHKTQAVPALTTNVQQTQEVTELKWLPGGQQPYFLLFDPTQETYDVVEKNGTVFYEFRQYKVGETKVDRGQHQIKSVNQQRFNAPSKWATREKAAETTMVATAVALTKEPEVQAQEEKEFISQNIKGLTGSIFTVDSLSAAVQTARLIQKRVLGEDYIGTCYRTEFDIRSVYTTLTDQLPVFKNLSSYGNLARIAQEMTKLYEGATGGELNQSLSRLDRYLAKHVTDMLRGKLGLTTSVSSFMEDVPGLHQWLNDKKGSTYADLFAGLQTDLIADVLNFQDYTDEFSDAIVINTDSEQQQKLYYFGPTRRASVTTVDLLDDELKLGMYEDIRVPALIRQSSHPHLYEFAKATITGSVAVRSKTKAHYLVTADDVVYALTKAAIGVDTFLIRKVS